MIIHHAHRLHEGVTNRRADKLEAALLQGLGHRRRLRGFGGLFLPRFTVIDQWLTTDKTPQQHAEARLLRL